MRARLWRQRKLARLRHQVEQVDKHCGFGDASVLDPVELDKAQHDDLSCRQDAEIGLVEQRHQVPHLNDPTPLETVDFIQARHEDVRATLNAGHCRQERFPE